LLILFRWVNFIWLFIVLIAVGCCWSIGQYVADYQTITEGYLRAKVIPTPFDNNHLWFSYAVVIAILLLADLPKLNRNTSGKAITYLLTVFFII